MATPRAFLGISHSPLIGLNPVAPEVEADLQSAIAAARAQVLEFDPELVVLLGSDHYNGFFNELMPPFCIGTQAISVGDYQTPSGPLNVDGDAALALAAHLMESDFDIALSRRMRVDHGFAQSLQMLWGSLATPPVVPIFVNAVAQPATRPRDRQVSRWPSPADAGDRLGRSVARTAGADARASRCCRARAHHG